MSDAKLPDIPHELWGFISPRGWNGNNHLWMSCTPHLDVVTSLAKSGNPLGDPVLVGVSPDRLARAEAEIERLTRLCHLSIMWHEMESRESDPVERAEYVNFMLETRMEGSHDFMPVLNSEWIARVRRLAGIVEGGVE